VVDEQSVFSEERLLYTKTVRCFFLGRIFLFHLSLICIAVSDNVLCAYIH